MVGALLTLQSLHNLTGLVKFNQLKPDLNILLNLENIPMKMQMSSVRKKQH